MRSNSNARRRLAAAQIMVGVLAGLYPMTDCPAFSDPIFGQLDYLALKAATAAGPLTTGHRAGEILPIALAASVQIYKGAAAAIVLGTGYGTPLVPTTVTHRFMGVWTETLLSSSTAGATFTRFVRTGVWGFTQTGLTAAVIGEPAYFSDDNTVTASPGTTPAGEFVAVDAAGVAWVDIEAATSVNPRNGLLLAGSADAVNPHVSNTYVITKAGVDAMTLAAPTATVDDFTLITITSSTANAHTLTATGLLSTGTTSVNVATFAAHAGAGLTLVAYQGLWQVIASVGITFS